MNGEGPGILYGWWACMLTDILSDPQIQLFFPTQTYWSYLCDFSALDLSSLTVTLLARRKFGLLSYKHFCVTFALHGTGGLPKIHYIYKGN